MTSSNGPSILSRRQIGYRLRLFVLLASLMLGGNSIAVAADLPPQVLRVGLDAVAASADPHRLYSVDSRNLAFHIFEPLIMPDNVLGTVPWLATGWDREGDRTWVIRLRPDVRFHDGKLLSPHDVAFTFCRLDSLESRSLAGLIAGVEQAAARDAYTLVITTRGPLPLLPHVLTLLPIIPAPDGWKGTYQPRGCTGAAEGLAALSEQRFAAGLVPGTGPYRLSAFNSGAAADLVRADGYWGVRPHWDRVRQILLETGVTRARALVSGEVDIVNQVVPETLDFLNARTDIKVVDSLALRTLMLTVNLAGPLSDVNIRRALAIAIDRTGLSKRIAQGGAEPADQMAPPGIPGYTPAASLPFDQAEARRLMRQSGVGDGQRLRLRLITVEPFARVAEGVARYLLAIGVQLDIRYASVGEALPLLRGRDYDLFLGSRVPFTGEMGYSNWELLHTPQAEIKAGSQNDSGYSNPELDQILSQAMVEPDASRREALLQQVAVIASRDLPFIPLLRTTRRWAMNADIRFEGRVDGNTLATLITPASAGTQ